MFFFSNFFWDVQKLEHHNPRVNLTRSTILHFKVIIKHSKLCKLHTNCRKKCGNILDVFQRTKKGVFLCESHIFIYSFQLRHEKVSYQANINLTVDCNVLIVIISEDMHAMIPQTHKAHQTVTFSKFDGISTMTC